MTRAIPVIEQFVDQKTVVLTSFRKNGVGVPTAVNIAVDGDRAFAKTWKTSGKYKRICNNPHVTIGASTFRGKSTGEPISMLAHVVTGSDFDLARRLIESKHPILQRVLVRLAHRLQRVETVFVELRPEP